MNYIKVDKEMFKELHFTVDVKVENPTCPLVLCDGSGLVEVACQHGYQHFVKCQCRMQESTDCIRSKYCTQRAPGMGHDGDCPKFRDEV